MFCEHIFLESSKRFINREICAYSLLVAMLPFDSLIHTVIGFKTVNDLICFMSK